MRQVPSRQRHSAQDIVCELCPRDELACEYKAVEGNAAAERFARRLYGSLIRRTTTGMNVACGAPADRCDGSAPQRS